jgi:LysM repeat protein
VATKNNIALSKLLGFNELAEDGMLTKNQFIYLQKKSKTGEKDFYNAGDGESLYDIAQKNGIQLQYLLDYNKLWGNEDIEAGRKIYLRPGLLQELQSTTVVKTAAIAAIPLVKTHIVKAKEGLYGIAKKYNVDVKQLKEWNKLQTDSLSVGQQLIIAQ